jgi:hypothetical protein
MSITLYAKSGGTLSTTSAAHGNDGDIGSQTDYDGGWDAVSQYLDIYTYNGSSSTLRASNVCGSTSYGHPPSGNSGSWTPSVTIDLSGAAYKLQIVGKLYVGTSAGEYWNNVWYTDDTGGRGVLQTTSVAALFNTNAFGGTGDSDVEGYLFSMAYTSICVGNQTYIQPTFAAAGPAAPVLFHNLYKMQGVN